MKLVDVLLQETPLPDDWDKTIFDKTVPFTKRLKYARKKAEQLDAGSSRVAFVIPYRNRKTVLKIAKNEKGLVQNTRECIYFDNPVAKKSGFFIPMIDCDTTTKKPSWLHVEYAYEINTAQFHNFFGVYASDIEYKITELLTNNKEHHNKNFKKFVDTLTALNLDNMVERLDISSLHNWGLYKGRPVIIDFGVDDEILTKYYSDVTVGFAKTMDKAPIDLDMG